MADTHYDQLLVCATCGTQFGQSASQPLADCKICKDPRQYVPPSGQQWTSLAALRGSHSNVIASIAPNIWSITTEPKVGIGQRCFLIATPEGNVLWDCIAFLDEDTTAFITVRGGLSGIVISHPHYYTTHLYWASVFKCPVYIAAEDEEWCSIADDQARRRLIRGHSMQIVPSIEAIKLGGHFPGSLVLLYKDAEAHLFIADTIMLVLSGLTPDPLPGTTSFSFMWSYPNQIPLPPDELATMWSVLKAYDFQHIHGAFEGKDLSDRNAKARVLESMKIQARHMGWSQENAVILRESL